MSAPAANATPGARTDGTWSLPRRDGRVVGAGCDFGRRAARGLRFRAATVCAGAAALGSAAACGRDRPQRTAAGDDALGGATAVSVDRSPARIARLVAALRGADYGAAVDAVDSLAAVGPAATTALAPLIAGADVRARELAVRAAVDYGPGAAPAVPALVTVIGRGSDDRAFALAVRALGRIGPAAAPAVAPLAAVLDDPAAFNHHAEVLTALGLIGPGARPGLPSVLRKLDGAGPNSDPTRNAAALAAARIGGPDALGALSRELTAPTRPPRGRPADTVAVALARMGEGGVRVLSRASAAEWPDVRRAAIVGYRTLGAAGVPWLVRALADGRPCRYPYGGLGDTSDPVACAAEAASALGELGPPARAALPALERLLEGSPDAGVQDAARAAIARIRG
jgi:hypothetical protein